MNVMWMWMLFDIVVILMELVSLGLFILLGINFVLNVL